MGQYLFQRIKQLGTEHILGVPGDFNRKRSRCRGQAHQKSLTRSLPVTLLDEIYNVSGLKWIGCCNELNGAYAADGYARIKDSPAVLVTTYAVGELSAMNGVAGA